MKCDRTLPRGARRRDEAPPAARSRAQGARFAADHIFAPSRWSEASEPSGRAPCPNIWWPAPAGAGANDTSRQSIHNRSASPQKNLHEACDA